MENRRKQPAGASAEPEACSLAGFVSYQKGSIVSRTIIDKKAGTVTAFAFDEGQGLSEHTAPFDALVHVIDGEANIMISGRDYSLKAGDFIVMPAGAVHALKAVKPFKMLLTMVRS